MKEYIRKTLRGEHLTFDEASQAMELVMTGMASPSQVAGLLVALHAKGEKPQEVAGFVTVMRRHAVAIELEDADAVDGCGTGGDSLGTFNISTAAALVAAAAGVTVAKHGNRSVSSKCGSADLLESCGANIDPGPEAVKRSIDQYRFGFMFAPRFHPAMKHAAGPRRELGVRTVFNMLGPMCNPAGVRRQLIGVYSREVIPLMVDAMEMAGVEHLIVAHSHDGLDEFSVANPTEYIELRNGNREAGILSPENVGLRTHDPEAMAGGNPVRNVAILHQVMDGQGGAHRDAVVFNAGAMIYVAGKADSIADGVRAAEEAIDSGKAAELLEVWIRSTRAGGVAPDQ
jgi:anthranilate phosphoribosyltransferase